jgi:hypothetical protein
LSFSFNTAIPSINSVAAMRRIVNSTYVTLDSVVQNPQDWPSVGGFSDEGNQVQTELLERCDAVLMGRHTSTRYSPRCGLPALATRSATV